MRLSRLLGKDSFASTALISCVLLSAAGRSLEADPVFDARGFQSNRELLSELPFEHIDPMTGNVLLTFTDLVLPGNGGFDLRIQRTYNSKIFDIYGQLGKTLEPDSWAGIGWRLHMGRVLNFNSVDPGPIVEMPDGSRHQLYRHLTDVLGTHYISKDYWTYEKAVPSPILRLPNGLKYTFGHWQGDAFIYATEIEDPFGNRITIEYQPPPAPADAIHTITQHLVGGQTRTVEFTFTDDMPDPNGDPQEAGSLATMEFNGHIWTYSQSLAGYPYTMLDEVKPPLGFPWKFEYEDSNPAFFSMLKHLETPNGGEIDYTYVAQLFHVGSTAFLSPALTQRQISGRNVPSGTWTYEYASSQAENDTIVTSPCNVKTTSFFLGIGDNNLDPWAIGALDKRVTTDGNDIVFETEDLTWIASVPISNSVDPPLFQTFVALLGQRDLIRSGTTYSTEYTYSTLPYSPSRPNNFNDFGRAHTIQENGDSSRTTTRTFFYGSPTDPSFETYIVDKIKTETVQVGSESFAKAYDYDADTGFKTSETIYGITTMYKPHSKGIAGDDGNVGKVTDANNNSTTFDYSWGVASMIKTPEYTIVRAINTDGTIASETRRQFTTDFTYDALMRPTKTAPHVGNPVDTTYDNFGGASVTVTRGSSSLVTALDGFGRPTGTQNSVGVKTSLSYDACGRTTFASYPFDGVSPVGTTFQYDPLGRVERRTHPDNKFVEYDYSNGVDVLITDEEGRETLHDWSAFGDPGDARLTSLEDAEESVTQYTYNALGSLKSSTLPGGTSQVRTWTYNAKNQLESEGHPENGETSYTYDLAGNLTTRSDAQFGTTMFTYDKNNRLVAIDRPGDAHDVAISYDESDNRTELTSSDVSSLFTYDEVNRLVLRTDELDGVLLKTAYQYDPNDNLDLLTYPSGLKVDYDYDTENRITRIKKASGPGAPYADAFDYHASGALEKYVAGNGLTHTLSYNNRYRLWKVNPPNGTNVLRLTYGYDGAGNVTSIVDSRGAGFNSSFSYDDLDRLEKDTLGHGTPEFSYDPAGNRLTKRIGTTLTSYEYAASTQYLMSATTGAATENFTYDLNGNLTSDANGANTYAYTATNMLKDASIGGTSTRYLYDGDDLRKARIGVSVRRNPS